MMVNSVSGAGAPGLATALMNKKSAEEQIAVEVAKKGLDVQKAEGGAALKLIASAAPASGKIDVYV